MQITSSRAILGLFAAFPALLTPLLLSMSSTTNGDEGLSAKEIAAAGELFGSSCSACHLPPDPDHELDRAWLNQVTDTA